MATANPALNVDVYRRAALAPSTGVMTLQGAVVKTLVLMAVLLATGVYAWTQALSGVPQLGYGLMLAGLIGGAIVAFVTIFMPKISPVTAPLYAALQGLLMGGISAVYEKMYSGLVIQAISLSVATLTTLLLLYASGVIRATEKFKIGVIGATGAVCLVYIANLVVSMFGVRLPFIHETGIIGIGFSLVVVVIAALNLILDFDFIEQGVERQAPKYMEWYGGFSLLVTLVWMYLEMLRLLAKLRGSRN
jgi:uncharacterized YccA/Bax inhibitor family protein